MARACGPACLRACVLASLLKKIKLLAIHTVPVVYGSEPRVRETSIFYLGIIKFRAIGAISSSDDIEFNTKVIKGVIKEDNQIYKKRMYYYKIFNPPRQK